MRKYGIIITLVLTAVVSNSLLAVRSLADSPLAKELQITQIKITGDEFVVLHNATDSNLNLGNYWLQYYNEFNLSVAGVSNSSQQLPSVTLQPNQEILLAVGAAANCGQVWVSKLSFSLKDSAGLLQVVGISQISGAVSYKSQDQVSWSSKTTDAVDLKGISTSSTSPIWYRSASGWLSSSLPIGCTPVGSAVSASTSTPATLTRLSSSPPSVVLGASTPEPAVPSANVGLAAPQISELLPNPGPPQTDATDEFIELYNPNNTSFDLSGYVLRAGATTYHTYSFPVGQFVMQPHEFRAFYAPQTGISLSNSEGQAAFLDPAGNLLVETDVYQTAKDSQAWVYADGLWQWTTSITPNASNVITAPLAAASKKATAAKTTKSKTAGKTSAAGSSTSDNSTSGFVSQTEKSSLLHPLVLAVVAGLAVLYACYEYRHDIANTLYRLRRHRAHRRSARQIA